MNLVKFLKSLLRNYAKCVLTLLIYFGVFTDCLSIILVVPAVSDRRWSSWDYFMLWGRADRHLRRGCFQLFLCVEILQLLLFKTSCFYVIRVWKLFVKPFSHALSECIDPMLGSRLCHLVANAFVILIWIKRFCALWETRTHLWASMCWLHAFPSSLMLALVCICWSGKRFEKGLLLRHLRKFRICQNWVVNLDFVVSTS